MRYRLKHPAHLNPIPEPARTGHRHQLKHQRTELVVGLLSTIRRGNRFARRCTRESGVNRQSMPCLERGRLGFPEKVQGSEVCAWIKAAVSLAIRTLRTRAVESFLTQGAEMGIDGNWERGRVWFNKLRTENRAITITHESTTPRRSWCTQEN